MAAACTTRQSAKAATLLGIAAAFAAIAVSGCRPAGKTETKADLPAREKALNDSMQKSYGGGGAQGGGGSGMAAPR